MKRILRSLFSGSVLSLPIVALAVSEPGTVGYQQALTNVRTALWTIFVTLAVIMFIWAGVLFLTAGGDPDKVTKARTALIYGVVGIVVAVLGYSIMTIVMGVIGV